MVIWQGEHLVRVTSHGELKAGLTVVERNCNECGCCHALVLLCKESLGGWHLDDSPCQAQGWRVSPCGCLDGMTACFCREIREGRLYRLQEPPAEVNDYEVQATPAKAKKRTR